MEKRSVCLLKLLVDGSRKLQDRAYLRDVGRPDYLTQPPRIVHNSTSPITIELLQFSLFLFPPALSHTSHAIVYVPLLAKTPRIDAMSGVEAVFGVVTGGAGLVSLGLQLMDSAKRLKRMYNTIKDAPKSLDTLSFEVETMALSLHLLDQQRQRLGPNSMEVVFERCLAVSQERTQEIQQIVDSLTRHMEKHARLRGKVYFAFKDRDVEELLNRLEKVKSSLQMSYAMYQNEVAHNMLAHQGKMLQGIQMRLLMDNTDAAPPSTPLHPTTALAAASVATMDKARKSSHGNHIRVSLKSSIADWTLFGITVTKRRARRADASYRFRLCLPYWCRIWDTAITLTQYSLGFELTTYNLVPLRSAIFYYCERGNLATMQELLQSGRARLLDVRERTWHFFGDDPCYESLLEVDSA